MVPKVERISDLSLELGEGPHWDEATQTLYYIDIFGKSIHKYVPASNIHTKATFDKNVSLIVPVAGTKDQFLISLDRDLVIVTWDGISPKASKITKIAEGDTAPGLEGNRFNDGKADPSGRLWVGTMGAEPIKGQIAQNMGTLYSLERNNQLKAQFSPVSISNGLAWNAALQKFYYIDSSAYKIYQFDFDIDNGTISNKQTIFTFEKHNIPGLPDGQCIDTDGNLWVAVFNGSRILKIDPRKPETLLETIEMPAKQVTSVAFGGPNMDELFVTTARIIIDGVVLNPPDHGAVYRVTGTGAKGLPGVSLKL